MDAAITRADIDDAAVRIAPYIRHTPVIDLGHAISEDWSLLLKLDNLQVTGSFKARGAFNVLLTNDNSAGVVAPSGGNFGKAVAFAARELGVSATIFVPETSPTEKTDPISALGADLKLIPGYFDDALAASVKHANESGALFVHAYDQAGVVAGQGTAGLEIAEQVPDADTVLVAVGGGGLIGGVASWYQKTANLIAVESEGCPTFYEARKQGHPVDVEVGGVAASSLGARRIGDHCWAVRQWIDQSILVTEESILAAQRWLWDTARLWVEPAAAVPIAALRTGNVAPRRGDALVALISGGNVSPGY